MKRFKDSKEIHSKRLQQDKQYGIMSEAVKPNNAAIKNFNRKPYLAERIELEK